MYVMGKGRLEAFSDAVLAIVITIMVLELRAPESAELSALLALAPRFLTYLLSFVYLAIYWNNHHHLLHAAPGIDGAIMWANLHLLFWLSLIPFATAWLGQTGARAPTAIYGVVLFMAALAYFVLQRSIIRKEPVGSTLAEAVGAGREGKSVAAALRCGHRPRFLAAVARLDALHRRGDHVAGARPPDDARDAWLWPMSVLTVSRLWCSDSASAGRTNDLNRIKDGARARSSVQP